MPIGKENWLRQERTPQALVYMNQITPFEPPHAAPLINNCMEDKKKTGPKPKELKSKEIWGLEVGRGDSREIVPPDQVYELTAIGCNIDEISRFFGVKPDTLSRNFADEITKGKEFQKIRLRRNLFKSADNLNPAVLIFLAKAVLGMSETSAESVAPLPWGSDLPEVDNEEEIMYNTDNVKET